MITGKFDSEVMKKAWKKLEYNFIQRMIHWFFSTKSLFPFIGYYVLLNIFIIVPGLIFIYAFGLNMKIFEIKSYSTLIGVQVGVLGVISIALALVTIIAPKNNETSIIEIYYHESRAFEIISSSFALLGVFSIQIFISIQPIAPLFVIENIIPLLSIIPFFWLMINLLGVNHFIMTTLDFVNPDKRRRIRKQFTRNLVQSNISQNADLPDSSRILEELAKKAVSKIDQNDLGEFRIVWGEMVDYHCFLFSLIIEQKENGGSTAFANCIDSKFVIDYNEHIGEVTYEENAVPYYIEWRKQYNQIFKRATDKIPVENEFVKILADTPKDLLSIQEVSHLSKEIIMDILELIPSLMQYMGEWMFKRTIFNKPCTKETNKGVNHLLPNMEVGIYKESVQYIIEEWKKLTSSTMVSLYGRYIFKTDVDKLNTFRSSWYFQREHLCKTAEMLIFAISQHDDVAVRYFQKTLLEWKQNVPFQWSKPSKVAYFLPFDIIEKDWSDVKKQEALLPNGSSIQPCDSYLNIMNNTHQDILFIISALLLYWLNRKKHSSEVDRDVVIKFLDELQDGPDLSFHMLRFISFEFDILFESDHYKCDVDYYKKILRDIMRGYNGKKCSNFYNSMNDEYENGKCEWKQIMEACVIIFARSSSVRKDDLGKYMDELGKEKNRVMDDFIGCLKEMALKLEEPSRFIAALTTIGYEGNPDEVLNALHCRIGEVINDLKCVTTRPFKQHEEAV